MPQNGHSDKGVLQCRFLPKEDIDGLIEFIKTECYLEDVKEEDVIICVGITASSFQRKIEEGLGVRWVLLFSIVISSQLAAKVN